MFWLVAAVVLFAATMGYVYRSNWGHRLERDPDDWQ